MINTQFITLFKRQSIVGGKLPVDDTERLSDRFMTLYPVGEAVLTDVASINYNAESLEEGISKTDERIVSLEDVLIMVDDRLTDIMVDGKITDASGLDPEVRKTIAERESFYGQRSTDYLKEMTAQGLRCGPYTIRGTLLHQTKGENVENVIRLLQICRDVPFIRVKNAVIGAGDITFSADICLVRTSEVSVYSS